MAIGRFISCCRERRKRHTVHLRGAIAGRYDPASQLRKEALDAL